MAWFGQGREGCVQCTSEEHITFPIAPLKSLTTWAIFLRIGINFTTDFNFSRAYVYGVHLCQNCQYLDIP